MLLLERKPIAKQQRPRADQEKKKKKREREFSDSLAGKGGHMT